MNSNKFYYENGQGEILDEAGNEAMDWEEHFDPFNNKLEDNKSDIFKRNLDA
jgi:hypothetical protein